MKEDHHSYRLNFAVASISVMIFFHIILHPAVLIYDFYIFITSVMDELARPPFVFFSLPRMLCASLEAAGKQKPSSPFACAFSRELANRLGFSEGSSLL